MTGPELLREVILKEYKYLLPRSMLGLPRLIGNNSIFFSTGETHKAQRRMYHNAFNKTALEKYVQNFDALITSHLRSACQAKSIYLYEEMRRLACEAVTRVMLGMNVSEREVEKVIEISNSFLEGLFSLPCAIPGSAYKKVSESMENMNETLQIHSSNWWMLTQAS